MAYKVDDRIAETTTGTGTGSLTLAGALTAYKAFSSVMANGDTTEYLIVAVDANGIATGDWETGIGTWNTGNILARTLVKKSSNANALVNFTAGTKRVYLSYISDANPYYDPTDVRGMFSLDGFPTPFPVDNPLYQVRYAVANINVASFSALGFTAAAVGTLTLRSPLTTNYFTRRGRTGIVSAATAGAFSDYRANTNILSWGDSANPTQGGFKVVEIFGCSDAATVAGARQIAGVRTSAAMTNVEPNTLTNCVLVGHGAADTNLKIFFGGSAAQTPIDLGANFPVNTLSVDLYRVTIVQPPNNHLVCRVSVERLNTGHRADNTLTAATAGVQLPAALTMLAPQIGRTNNATALAVGLDIGLVWMAYPW